MESIAIKKRMRLWCPTEKCLLNIVNKNEKENVIIIINEKDMINSIKNKISYFGLDMYVETKKLLVRLN